ncbi:MAG TPA: DUF1810 domain-containing protein [Spongiibacteraceae bacterium]|nr:DUF1810 domain-containing protein [Spongiibacteraceae bacterium]
MIASMTLQHFVDAQNPIYAQICQELRDGSKHSHWMWFVFPQIEGLGYSAMAQRYALHSLDEARAYLAHPLLGARLRECTALVNRVEGKSIEAIFGYPDDMKFHSSMTLFAEADAGQLVFVEALRKYFGGERDVATLERLRYPG